jgi:pimeloyl-ACP methyl ester carboxylesterase
MNMTRAEEWRNRGGYFCWRPAGDTADPVQIFHVELGDPGAPVLLLVHGWPTSSIDWFEAAGQLSARFRVCALDFSGYGFSAKPRGWGYSLGRDEELIEYYLAEVIGADAAVIAAMTAVTAWRYCTLPGARKAARRQGWSTWSCPTATCSCRCRT